MTKGGLYNMQHKGQKGNGEEDGKVEDENVQRSHFERDFIF